MKKIIFALIGIIGLCVFIYSCSQEKTAAPRTEQTRQAAFDDLNAQIALLNARYSSSFAPETRARKKGWFWRGLFKTLKADLSGAVGCSKWGFWGILTGGIVSSIDAVFNRKDFDVLTYTDDDGDSDQNRILVPGEKLIADLGDDSSVVACSYNSADSIGYFHNKIISEIYEEIGDGLYTMDADDRFLLVCEKVEKYFGPMPASIESRFSEYQMEVTSFLEKFSVPDADPIAVLEAEVPERKAELSVINDFIEAISNLTDEEDILAAYTVSFNDLIRKSELLPASKEFIEIGVAVGGNSALLWEEGGVELEIAN